MLILVPFVVFLLGLGFGYLPMRVGRIDLTVGFAALMLALGIWAFHSESASIGIDVLLYTLLTWGVVVPGMIATSFGVALGVWDRGHMVSDAA